MMIYGFNKFSFLAMLLIALMLPFSCTDLEYDQPPAGGQDPNIPTNTTIAELKDRHTIGEYEEITDDAVLSALVISDDAAGNFFKQLVIQDATGGIELRVDVTDLNNQFPVGRKVYLKAKGLWLGDYNGLIQLGAGVGADAQGRPELIRIPESILDNYLVPATYGNPVVPEIKNLSQLDLGDVSTLVQFDNVQFITADAGETYADAVLQQTLNREIEDCSHTRIILRSSGFANFASALTPTGGGSIIGVLGIFGSDFQLTIRDTSDVDMKGDRCGGGGGANFNISEIRSLFSSGTTVAPNGTITGTVISDYTTGTIHGFNMYVQDATGGIVVRYTDDHTFELGDEVKVNIGGAKLGVFHGLVQIDMVDLGGTQLLSHPGDVTPRLTTVAEALANATAWESTLIKIDSVTLTDNTVFNGNVIVTDHTGSMILRTGSGASFAGQPLPTGKVSITAIMNYFDAPQLLMRARSDVKGGGGGTGGGDVNAASLREAFNQGTTSAPDGELKGVVISDYASQSVHGLSMYMQDSTGGIVIRFTGDHLVPVGSEVSVTINGGSLSEFNGLLQVNGIAPGSVSITGTPGDPAPRLTTVEDVLDNSEAWESTLVEIKDVTLSGNSTFDGNINVTDATGTIVLFTRAQATFSGDNIPSGTVDIIAIVSEFNNTQLIIRTPSDIQ